ncbi:MAG: endonuclease/exonuclease/phosphatase family protein [Chloroflexota bacterium]|nr:endonuclease/exonuclease/phosphatase family protein [Chloroflexota bacterium]
MSERSLRILTLNLWGRGGIWEDRRPVLSDGLRQLQPDVVAFQESVVTQEYDQIRDLLKGEFHVAHQAARHADGMGVSIASRWPMAGAHELDLHLTDRTDEFPCTTLAVEVAVPAPIGPLFFVNHFPSWQLDFQHERQVQAVAAARFIDALVGERPLHVVVAGDLDADPDAGSIRFWTGREALGGTSVCYRDAWESAHPDEPGHTYTPRNPLMSPAARDWPFRRIDYILVRCGMHSGSTLDVASCERVFNEPIGGVWASDHFGVMAKLTLH